MIGYIYIITNTITGKQYVGQTIQTIETRFQGHISSAKCNTDKTYLHNSMNKYGHENFKVKEITHIDCISKDILSQKLNELEIYYIKKYNTLVPGGYNLTKGGTEGAELYKRKIDEYDLNGNFIQTHNSIIEASEYAGSNYNTAIFKCCAGKCTYAFQKIWRYHGDPLNKYKVPEITIAQRINKKAIVSQYSKDGKLIATYNSIVDTTSFFEKEINLSHISECCKGKLYTAYGYVWRYGDDSFDKYNSNHDKRFSGCQKFDLQGNLLGTYSSIKEACISIDKDPQKCNSHIVSCCKGARKSAYGYKWKYIES